MANPLTEDVGAKSIDSGDITASQIDPVELLPIDPRVARIRFLVWLGLCGTLIIPFYVLLALRVYEEGRMEFEVGYSAFMCALLLALVVGIAFLLLRQTEADKGATSGERTSQVFIFAITVASFYAFGWPDEFLELRHKFSELGVIIVLFLLAELAVHQMREARTIAERIGASGETTVASITTTGTAVQVALDAAVQRLSGGLSESANDLQVIRDEVVEASKKIVDANLGEVAAKLVGLNGVAVAVECIKNASVRERLITSLSDYAGGWARHFAYLEEDAESARLRCWQTVCDRYLKEELSDLGWEPNGNQFGTGRRIALATNERLYFELLIALANSVRESGEGEPVYRAITNMLPEDWFNGMRGRDGQRFASKHIDKFRQTVFGLIDKKFEYQRAILVSEFTNQPLAGDRIAAGQALMSEEDKCMLYLGLSPEDKLKVRSYSASVWRELYTALGISDDVIRPFLGNRNGEDPLREVYGIIPKALAISIISDAGTTRAIRVGSRSKDWIMKWEPLVDVYIREMHDNSDSARVIMVKKSTIEASRDHFLGLPRPNPDWLVVGYRKNESECVWLMALTANLALGSETMLVDIVVDQDSLERIERFWGDNDPPTLRAHLSSA